MNWKSIPRFGKFGDKRPIKEQKTLIQILVQRKDYLHWCYTENMHQTNDEIKWIWDNIKEKERDLIINYKGVYDPKEFIVED